MADIWEIMQDTAILLAKHNQITITLQSYVTQISVDDEVLKSLIGPEGSLSDADRFEKSCSESISTIESLENSELLFPSDIDDFDSIEFEVFF